MDFSTLKAEEFSELPSFGGFRPDPRNSVVVVGREGTQIVARSCILALAHIEGTHIEPEFRNGFVLKRLMRAVEEEAARRGLSQLLAYAADQAVEDYLGRLGYQKMQLTVWEKKI